MIGASAASAEPYSLATLGSLPIALRERNTIVIVIRNWCKLPREPMLGLKRMFLFGMLTCLLGCGCGPSTPTDPVAIPAPPAGPSPAAASVTQVQPVPVTNMVLIKAGSFLRLGHTVTLSRDFWLGKYEVTQADYGSLMGRNPSHFKERPNAPVEKVSYLDAVAYCDALTLRERQAGHLPTGWRYQLPSEAQWEYACRAGTTNLYSFGDSVTNAADYAWTWENSEGAPHSVGEKHPNAWGLHDMHGNVWEWCLDWFGAYPAMNTIDPAGALQGKGRVFRGGGWNNEIQFARSANRFVMAPTSGIHFVGFRVALSQYQAP
jgi:formylglycine-generating enzyme required for sulfatase activity